MKIGLNRISMDAGLDMPLRSLPSLSTLNHFPLTRLLRDHHRILFTSDKKYEERPEGFQVRKPGRGMAGAGVSDQNQPGQAEGVWGTGSGGAGINFQSVRTTRRDLLRVPFVKFSGPLGIDFTPTIDKLPRRTSTMVVPFFRRD